MDPAPVALPDLAAVLGGGRLVLDDVAGEFVLAAVLREGLGDDAAALAAGWRGDRYALWEDASGTAVLVSLSAWADDSAATAFANACARLLARKPRVVNTGAAAHGDLRGRTEQRAGQRGGRCGVADPHLAADEHIALDGNLLRTHRQRALELRGRHRRFAADVGGARCDLQIVHARQRRRRLHRAEVDDAEIRPPLLRQHGDGGAAEGKVADHLHRHGLREGGYALLHHAVVGREHADTDMAQARHRAALPAGHPDRQVLQPAQRARRLGQAQLSLPRRVAAVRTRLCRCFLPPRHLDPLFDPLHHRVHVSLGLCQCDTRFEPRSNDQVMSSTRFLLLERQGHPKFFFRVYELKPCR